MFIGIDSEALGETRGVDGEVFIDDEVESSGEDQGLARKRRVEGDGVSRSRVANGLTERDAFAIGGDLVDFISGGGD